MEGKTAGVFQKPGGGSFRLPFTSERVALQHLCRGIIKTGDNGQLMIHHMILQVGDLGDSVLNDTATEGYLLIGASFKDSNDCIVDAVLDEYSTGNIDAVLHSKSLMMEDR